MLKYLSILKENQLLQDISNEDLKDFLFHATILEVKKKTILYLEGSTDDNIYILVKGIVRGYSTRHGKQVVELFLTKGNIIANINTIILDGPSKNTMESLTSCVLLTFSKTYLVNKQKNLPQIQSNLLKVLAQYINMYNERLKIMMQSPSATHSYLKFIDIFKDDVDAFPSKDIASYLGITPEALARIKKNLKHFDNPTLSNPIVA